MMFKIRPYTASDREAWNSFVRNSKNGTFLFDRDYMDYHNDRFQDYSLIALDDQDRFFSLLPANRIGTKMVSHAGLTYGGLITDSRMTTPRMLEAFDCLIAFLGNEGVQELEYKTIPSIYHKLPAQEDLYALFRLQARLKRRDVLSVIDYPNTATIQERRSRGLRKAEKHNIEISESDRWEDFWQILSTNLHERYEQKPVHSVDEIRLLNSKFPSQIRLFTAQHLNRVLGGAVMYCATPVAHVQYIACDAIGRQYNALDLLFARLIEEFSSYDSFDFGISTEQNGQMLNQGLVDFKEGFGARAVVHDHYVLNLS